MIKLLSLIFGLMRICRKSYSFALVGYLYFSQTNVSLASESSSQKAEIQDWQAAFSLGFGNALYMNNRNLNLLQSSFKFLFHPIHDFKNLEAKIKIMTQSPTKEDDGFIEIPLRDYDFSQVSEIWLKYQIFKNLQFKVGRFPDTPDELTPISWPYQSIFGKLDFVRNDLLVLSFLSRHDLLSVYSYQSNKSTATNIERTRAELNLEVSQKLFALNFCLNFRSFYDYFADPDYALSSLTFGREQYIEKPVTNYDQKYRLLTYSGAIGIKNELFESLLVAKYWSNLVATNYSFGKMFGFEQNIILGQTNLQLAFYKFFAEQNAAPPSVLSSNYFPGFQITAFHAALFHKFTDQVQGTIDYRFEQADVYGQSNVISMSPGMTANIPKYKIFFILEYLFDSFTTKDILTRQ